MGSTWSPIDRFPVTSASAVRRKADIKFSHQAAWLATRCCSRSSPYDLTRGPESLPRTQRQAKHAARPGRQPSRVAHAPCKSALCAGVQAVAFNPAPAGYRS